MNDLTVSNIERQNVLNNNYALQAIQENLDVNGLRFHEQLLFTTKMVAEFYDVDERTIKRYVQEHGDELRDNGYFLSEGNSLKELKLHFVGDINVPKFTRQLGIFPFRAFLNIGMLLTKSEKAKQLRTRILDIVIATINGRAGGGTKYINWRDRDYLPTAIKSENYRKNFTQAVGKYVDGLPTYKYEQITDLIYKAVFRENAKEYREVLRLQNEENVRHTLYAEVLLCISSFENGVAHEIANCYSNNGNKQLTIDEVKDEGGIRKVLDFVQNDLYYPTFIDKLTYLVFGLCTGHYFEDSNKRVALTIGVWFLVHNGYYWHAYNFMQCMEAIIYHVAAGRIDKVLLQRIITYFMINEDYPEDLKLEIIHAIDDQPTGIAE